MERLVFTSLTLLVGFFTKELRMASAVGWLKAHATFYTGSMGGACGYENVFAEGFGINTAALSTALFNEGKSCGGCYQIVCDTTQVPQWCKRGKRITITATNFCPPNYDLPNDDGGWCNPPRPHFDMSQPAFETIANYKAGIVPIFYRKVKCKRNGGLRFTVKGHHHFELVVISNVGGDGEISQVWIKGSNMNNWEAMSWNWGVNWQSLRYLNGQSLSFKVQLGNRKTRTAYNVAPSNWNFGQTFQSQIQF